MRNLIVLPVWRPIYIKLIYYLLFFSVVVHSLYNLSYNSPFNDEAIYIVIGKLGIFQHDWISYGSPSWIAGWQYIYPVITALAFQSYGIVGSRFLNVIFSIMALDVLTLLIIKVTKVYGIKKYIMASLLVITLGYSGTFFFVSRLATMDMLSFLLYIASCCALVYGLSSFHVSGIYFFIAGLCLVVSMLTKYSTAILLPFSLSVVLCHAKMRTIHTRRIYIVYFILPVVVLVSMYIATNMDALMTFYQNEIEVVHSSRNDVLIEIWENIRYLLPFWVIGSIGMMVKKQWKWFLLFTLLALLFPLYHFITSRVQTLNKHIFITVTSLSCISTIGIYNLLIFPMARLVKVLLVCVMAILYSFHVLYSASGIYKGSDWWLNTENAMLYFEHNVKSGDRVLVESGSSMILANYPSNHPQNVTTFDWFTYQGKEGFDAYISAVKDGYFSYIQLEHDAVEKDSDRSELSKTIKGILNENYISVYDQEGVIIYKRDY